MKIIQKILLPLNGTSNAEGALTTGLLFARQFGGHIAALHVRADSREVAPLAGEGLSGAMVEEMMSAAEREGARRALSVREAFDHFTLQNGIAVTGPIPPFHGNPTGTATASFVTMTGREHEVVTYRARLSDVTIVAHPDSGEEVSSSETLHAILFDSGRPVIIAPRQVPQTAGRRICIAWNGTAEATAALHHILPWAAEAEAVRILYSADYQRRGPEARHAAEYLAIHGIEADLLEFSNPDETVGANLLAACRDFGADMLTMGAYSHSRLRQLILGGVTRHVLENAELPVLMSR
ncbi:MULTISPECIES: universal stress protein [Nguyenibacter]|uniref:Universal stress protein n=1 Tax=Nguyenibacter vanlangensis TaxID=1216886 RepID=A0A7Y7IUQ4_9PROT|nr:MULTISPECIES: universal stress protein [Nguyenibacter]NVN10769.1 universal stress protein [Nguyenibacter vanlangensis]WRH87679.1 universal stress protein [Nguyenibacter sp. L1]